MVAKTIQGGRKTDLYEGYIRVYEPASHVLFVQTQGLQSLPEIFLATS